MKYFIDTEFLEGTQTKKNLIGWKSQTIPTIDLISIAITCEDGREYYAISRDFNVTEAWERSDLKLITGKPVECVRDYWIRDNVMVSIYKDLIKMINTRDTQSDLEQVADIRFDLPSMKKLVKWYGKTNKEIATEILEFIYPEYTYYTGFNKDTPRYDMEMKPVQFYGYYADYDWVVFCWLFGKMKDFPAGFPMYCRDLQQMIDEKISPLEIKRIGYDNALHRIKNHRDYPKPPDGHNAKLDARWNFHLYKFLIQL